MDPGIPCPLRGAGDLSITDRDAVTLDGLLEVYMAEDKAGELQRTATGTFVKGQSGNPAGRPKGSKNRITLLKAITEERFRDASSEKVDLILHSILDAAIDGDPQCRKMVWDAHISKANISEDKTAGNKQEIKINTMNVSDQGATIDITPEEVNDE